MKALALAVLLFTGQAFAWTYNVIPPIDKTQCPTGLWANTWPGGWDTNFNCYYTITGAFTDNYVFDVGTEAVYKFEVKGSSLHTYTNSGRAHMMYTTSNIITNVVLTDASGAVVLQLVDTPYWSHPHCVNSFQRCSQHQTDDWTGNVDLPPGQYNLTVTGVVSGNRPGIYSVSIQPPPPPPVQLPLAPLTLPGPVTCDLAAGVCTLVPVDAAALTMISFDFTNNVARLVPTVALDPYTGPLTYDLVATNDDGTQTVIVFSFAGQAILTDGVDTVTVVFSMDEVIDTIANTVVLTNWQVSTQ